MDYYALQFHRTNKNKTLCLLILQNIKNINLYWFIIADYRPLINAQYFYTLRHPNVVVEHHMSMHHTVRRSFSGSARHLQIETPLTPAIKRWFNTQFPTVISSDYEYGLTPIFN